MKKVLVFPNHPRVTMPHAVPVRRAADLGIAESMLTESLSQLHAYWLSKRHGRAMPARRDIKPEEIGPLLRYVSLLEEIGGRLRFRLVGAQLAEAYGSDLSRKYVDEVLPETRYQIAARCYAMVLASARPLVSRSRFTTSAGAYLLITRLLLPLSEDGIRPNMVIAGLELDRGAPKELLGFEVSLDPDEVESRFL